MALLAAPKSSAPPPPEARERARTPAAPQIALSLLTLITAFCLIIASITPNIAHHNVVVLLLSAVLSSSALANTHSLFRRQPSTMSLIGAWLSSLGSFLVLGVGALHALDIVLAGGQLDAPLLIASTYVIPGATVACLAGGIFQLPSRWRLPTFAVTCFFLVILCTGNCPGMS